MRKHCVRSGRRPDSEPHANMQLLSPGRPCVVNKEHAPASRRALQRHIAQHRTRTFAPPLRILLLLSFAACTHMTSAEEHMEYGRALKRISGARERERAEAGVLLSRPVTSGHHGIPSQHLSANSHASTGSFDIYHSNEQFHPSHGQAEGKSTTLPPHSESRVVGGEPLQVVRERVTTFYSEAEPESNNLRAFDVKLEGVISLGTAPPEGSLPSGSIAGWPIGKPGGARNRHTLGTQPTVVLLDMFGNKQTRFCPPVGPCVSVDHPVTASIYNNPGCAKLYGTTTAMSVDGVATFTDLMIETSESRFRMAFTAGLPNAPVMAYSPPFKVMKGQIYIPDDALWNFNEAGIVDCQGCDDTAYCSSSSPRAYSPPGTQASRISIVAGQLIQSQGHISPGTSFQPCAGFQFPTVWVRKFNMHARGSGSEFDGWEDVPVWDYDIEVKMEEPGCILYDPDNELRVCRRGLEADGGSRIRRADDIKTNKGISPCHVFAWLSFVCQIEKSYHGLLPTHFCIPHATTSLGEPNLHSHGF